jgi:hypothetical protein
LVAFIYHEFMMHYRERLPSKQWAAAACREKEEDTEKKIVLEEP